MEPMRGKRPIEISCTVSEACLCCWMPQLILLLTLTVILRLSSLVNFMIHSERLRPPSFITAACSSEILPMHCLPCTDSVLATQGQTSCARRKAALVGGCQVVNDFQHHILWELCKRKSCRAKLTLTPCQQSDSSLVSHLYLLIQEPLTFTVASGSASAEQHCSGHHLNINREKPMPLQAPWSQDWVEWVSSSPFCRGTTSAF